MEYRQIKQIEDRKDLIVPCAKGGVHGLRTVLGMDYVDFDGEFSKHQTIYGPEGNKIYLLGIGDAKDAVKLEEAFRKLCYDTKNYWKSKIQLKADDFSEEAIKKAVIGLELGTYQIGEYKSKKEEMKSLTVEVSSDKKIKPQLEEGRLTGETINGIKALIDAPSNHKTPEYLGRWAEDSAKNADYKCTVLHQSELKKQGFDAVMAVGQGSVYPPVIIINEYMPKKGKKVDIGLVGEGIAFDTGGLSIKPSANLHYMKSDMGGAAVVLGVVELAAKLKLDVNIVGVVVCAENAVDSNSYRPGDVINSYSGKTIEIIDTDAEGRLVLADGLNFIIKKFKPKEVIDLATLTGSVVQTFGYVAAGMFTNNTEMADTMTKVGYETNERVWQLPMFEDYESDLHSDIADLRNFSGKPIAGAITAAKFLEAFTEDHKNWMHLDIAGVSFGDSPYAKMKSATGYGVQLITNYIKLKANI